MASTYSQLLIAERVMNMHSTYFTLLADKGGHFRIVGDRGSILSGSADESQSEASIIGLRVVVHVTVFQSLSHKGWSQLQYSLTLQMTVPTGTAAPCHEIIEPEAHIEQQTQPNASRRGKGHAHGMTVTFIKGKNKTKRVNQKWCIL